VHSLRCNKTEDALSVSEQCLDGRFANTAVVVCSGELIAIVKREQKSGTGYIDKRFVPWHFKSGGAAFLIG
jgi:hypothetical protein